LSQIATALTGCVSANHRAGKPRATPPTALSLRPEAAHQQERQPASAQETEAPFLINATARRFDGRLPLESRRDIESES